MWPRTSPCGPSRVTPGQVGLDGGQSLETCPPTTSQLHASSIHEPHYERLRSGGLPLPTACAAVERIQPFKSARVQIGGHLEHSCAPERSCSSDVRTMTRLGGMLSNRPLERPGANARAHVGAASAGRSAPGRYATPARL